MYQMVDEGGGHVGGHEHGVVDQLPQLGQHLTAALPARQLVHYAAEEQAGVLHHAREYHLLRHFAH